MLEQEQCPGCDTERIAAGGNFSPSDREAILAKIRELVFHPAVVDEFQVDEWDSTTAPAYYRGEAAGIDGAIMRIEQALEGHQLVLGHPKLQALCERVRAMKLALDKKAST